MEVIPILIVFSLFFSVVAIIVFFWSLKSDQYDDLDGAANRVLFDDGEGGYCYSKHQMTLASKDDYIENDR